MSEESKHQIPVNELIKKYHEFFNKAVDKNDRPPKQKHMRNIIMLTFQDKDCLGWSYFLKTIQFTTDGIYLWKTYIVCHSVIRDGNCEVSSFDKMLAFFSTPLIRMDDTNYYCVNAQNYATYLKNKINFHKKVFNIAGNMSVRRGHNNFPFSSHQDGLCYVSNILLYFESCLFFVDKQISKLHDGQNHSIIASGQNKMTPIYLTVEDTLGSYHVIQEVMRRLFLMPQVTQEKVVEICKQFDSAYFKMKRIIMVVSNFTFVTSLINMPSLSEISPTEKILRETNRSLESSKENLNVKVVKKKVRCNDESESNRMEYEKTINSLTQKIAQLESVIAESNNKFDKFKTYCTEKYNNDMTIFNEKLKVANDECSMLQKELEEMNNLHQKGSDEKLLKLKELYLNLRTEFVKAEQTIKELKSKLEQEQKTQNELNTKISQLKTNENKLLIEATKNEAKLAEIEAEYENIKLQSTEGTQQLVEKLNESKNMLQINESKYKQEISDLNTQLSEMVAKTQHPTLFDKMKDVLIEKTKYLFSIPDDNKLKATLENLSKPTKLLASDLEEEIKRNNTVCDNMNSYILWVDKMTENIEKMFLSAKALANVCSEETSNKLLRFSSEILSLHYGMVKQLEEKMVDKTKFEIQSYQLLSLLSDFNAFISSIPESETVEKPSADEEILIAQKKVLQAQDFLESVMGRASQILSGDHLNVNSKIFNNCKNLLDLIYQLTISSAHLQKEIVDKNKDESTTKKEFYRKNNNWTEGLISAAQAVGTGAHFLVQTADNTLSGSGSLEELIVASQDIAASTAQLVASSRVKADPLSENLKDLLKAASNVNKASNEVVSTTKSGINSLNSETEFDFTKISFTQAKRIEMNSQIRCLELESELEKERNKLLKIRSLNYHAGDIKKN